MIPKILHQIWIGNKPIPDLHLKWMNKFKLLHPDWQFYFWNDSNIGEFGVEKLLEICQTRASQSNIIRIEAVKKYGGIYCDTDVEPLRAFDSFLQNEAFVGWEVPNRVCNAIFGAIPEHPWLQRMSQMLPDWVAMPSPWGPTLASHNLADVTVYSVKTFYPFLWYEQPLPASECGSAYTIHYWNQSWKHS